MPRHCAPWGNLQRLNQWGFDMKKVDYEILAAAIKKQRDNIYFSTGYTSPECAAILAHSEAIARTFARFAHVDKDKFLSACGVD